MCNSESYEVIITKSTLKNLKTVCSSGNCTKTVRTRMIRSNDMEVFSESFLNTDCNNSFMFWVCTWCLYYNTPSFWSKSFTIQIMFFVGKWMIIHRVSFEFVITYMAILFCVKLHKLWYFIVYLFILFVIQTVMILNPTLLYVLRSRSCMCYDW